MRLKNLIRQDICFQYKYGFYMVYVILVILYLCILYALPEGIREIAVKIMILTDPAAMGLFFMGAIFMLEKSQRVLNSIAVSPVRTWEYIMSKAISIGLISIVVAAVLSFLSGVDNLIGILIGTLLGSVIFTMLGLLIALKTSTLNSFMVCTVPIEVIFFTPALLYLFGVRSPFLLLHPACSVMHLYLSLDGWIGVCILICTIWILVILWITNQTLKKMMKQIGGMKI